MEQIILVVHLLVALAIIGLIMIQQGKGADMGASFGAGASQTLLGSSGSGNALTKMTSWLAFAFFATSFGLAMVANESTRPADDLGIEIPVQSQMRQPVSDLPIVEDEPEAMSSTEDVPSLPESDIE